VAAALQLDAIKLTAPNASGVLRRIPRSRPSRSKRSLDNVRQSACSTVQGNPLAAETFETLVDMGEYSCAMCLCDRLWVDPDAESSNGVDFMEEKDMLRLDSMLLLVQLHIRHALQAKARAPLPPVCCMPVVHTQQSCCRPA
jgi:hypothetical protein